MSCNQFGFDVIKDDTNQTLRKRIVNVAKGDDQKAIILAGYVNSDEFLTYVKENIKTGVAIEKLLDVDNNTLEQLLNSYFITKHPKTIEHSVMDGQNGSIFGFDNAVTKSLAKTYCASLINTKFVEEVKKPKENRKPKADIIFSVIKEINTKFVKDVFYPFAKKLREINNPNANKSLDELNSLISSLKTATTEEKQNIHKQIKVIQLNLINTYGNIREKNYANLVALVAQNPNKWFEEVFSDNSLTDITRDFEDILNDESIFDGSYIDNDDSSEKDDGGINQMSKNWNESLPKSFNKLVNDDIKIYLNSIQRLNSTQKDVNGNYDLDQNNSLGVPTTYGSNYLIVQLTHMNFWSLDDFISSIEDVAKHREGLQGLIKIADDCKANRRFGYYLMSQINNPKMTKIQYELLDSSIKVDQSNKNVDASTTMINDLLNSIKSTYKTLYDVKDLDKIANELNTLKRSKEQLSKSHKNRLDDFIIDILIKYLPKIDIPGVRGYLASSVKNNRTTYSELLININQLISSIETVLDDINKETLRVSNAKRKNKNLINDAYLVGVNAELSEEDKSKEIFNYGNINFAIFNNPIINIVEKIINYSTIRTELNSSNAEGNMSSDTINNCFITNLLRQIGYSTEDEKFAGLERLKNFITKGDQYYYSPIYFGIKNEKGNLIQRGLFERDPNTGVVKVNPNAAQLLNISLFDGIKDRSLNKGLMYDGMSKGDYFLAQIDSYWNPIRHKTLLKEKEGDIEMKYAGYFMRTPSDAPKNFIIQSTKCNIDGLFTTLGTEETKYIQSKASNLEKEIKIKVRNTTTDKGSNSDAVWNNKKNKSYSKNIITVEEAYSILTNISYNRSYNGLVSVYDKSTNKVRLPLIVNTTNGDCIIWLEGDKIQGIADNRMERVSIKEIYSEDTNAIKNILNDNSESVINEGIKNGSVKQHLNYNHKLFRGFYQVLLGELNNFINNLNNVFTVTNKSITVRSDVKGLFEKAHYNITYNEEGEPQYIIQGKYLKYDKDPNKRKLNPNVGELSGNFFKFIKLFESNGFNVNDAMKKMLSLYGGGNALFSLTKTGGIKLNDKHDIIQINDNKISLRITDKLKNNLNTVVEQWLINFKNEIINRTEQYSTVLKETTYNSEKVQEAIINGALMEMNFDELFEGDSKYYKDAQEFLKRAKEAQAGGKAYGGYNFNDEIGGNIIDSLEDKITIKEKSISLPRRGTSGIIQSTNLYARNGFRAVTIVNTIKPSEYAPAIKKELIKEFSNQFDKDKAEVMANAIAKGYYETTKVNDAQSYITFEEFITRRYLDGTLDQYEDLIEQILDIREGKKDISELNLDDINARIQVQKNFYYDIQYDSVTGCYYPRQIKNAEFVLIPELIKGTDLEKLYNIMKANDIGQVNTAETSKAAKRDVLIFWDNNGVAHPEDFEKAINGGSYESYNDSVVENYYYRYLYKQQDVPQHLIDAKNKAGIQILKKLIDNASPETIDFINSFFDNYCANIKDSFTTLLNHMGWKITENGSIVNRNNNSEDLNFEEFWKRARVEAQRLGMDSNFIEYLTVDHLGKPMMPNWFNVASSKLENIAQAIFNSSITRQTLPGWHAAQITSVGHGAKVLDSTGKFRTLKYHPENEDGSGNEAYMEVLLPRWDSRIPKPKNEKEEKELLKKLETEGLDIHLGYRIPTEGKQSVSVMKVVGFLDDVYGSTIMVPDEWVTQTGSDFDVDSVYGICFKTYVDKKGNIKKIKLDTKTDIESVKYRYENYVKSQAKQFKQEKDKESPISQNLKKEKINKETFKDRIDDVYKSLFDSSIIVENSNTFKELTDKSAELWENLPVKLKYAIHHSNTILKDKKDIVARYINIVKLSDAYLGKEKDEDIINIISEYRDINDALLQILSNASSNYESFIAEFKSVKTNVYKEIIEQHKQDYFNKIQQAAEQLGIVSFETFKTWSIVEQNSRDARNNQILEDLISIMKHPSSREENYSRSNFDLLTKGKNLGDDLRGANSVVRSPYNPLDQIDFMENAISGRELKAMSVNRDTFVSVCNKVKPILSEDRRITVAYDANKYDYDTIYKSFNESGDLGVKVVRKGNKIYVTHNKLGWSNNNRNVIGQLITTYTSQTTAHILDAIKEGTIFNENKYTFGAFKTLIDIGIDYDTAIPFLMQPAITELVSVYHETNSVYIGGNVNIPRVALNRIANKYGVTINGLPITDYTPASKVLKAIKNVDGFVEAFAELFSANIDANKTINEQQFIIDGELLKNRLNSSEIFNNPLYQFAFDIGTLLTFNQLVDTAKHIDTLVKCVKPDKFGALQTVFGTRSILDEIKAIVELSDKPIANVLTVDGDNFIKAIYPGIESGNIDVKSSKYPYLAAFLKYATEPSVNINSKLFFTESEEFYRLVTDAQLKLGRRFNETEHKDFKQYVISIVYNRIPILIKPQTVDKNHQFIEDENRQGDNEADTIAKEYSRIYGYNSLESSDLQINDITNPTEEDIKKFNRLTPLQKVVWMQQNFTENSGICNFLKTNFFNQKELTEKGISHQTIRFTDQFDDIEELYIAFNKTFFNKNPLARLTALDLIKYAFIVEGFKFKKGSISKIIPNKTLYTDINNRGTGIVEAAEYQLYQGITPADYSQIINKFVRSHSNLIRTIRFNKSIKDPLTKKFINCAIINKVTKNASENMYYVPFTSENEELLNHLGIYENDVRGYIKIKRGKDAILYKVVLNEDKGFYLYPINLLEQTEVVDYSYNNSNNKFFISDFYERLIGEHNNSIEAYITIADSDVIKNIKNIYGISKKEIKYVNSDLGNINKIEELRTSGTKIEQASAEKFITDALAIANSPVEDGFVINKFVHNSDVIRKLFTKNVPVIQIFSVDENTSKKLCITQVQLSRKAQKQITNYFVNNKDDSKYKINEIPESERYIAEQVKKSGLVYSTIYKVEEVLEDDDIRASATEDVDFEEENNLSFIDNPSYLTANDIFYHLQKEAKETDSIAESIMSSLNNAVIDPNSAKSIWNNKKNIYTSAAEYYTRKSNKLLSQINEFVTSSGEIFSIDEERLYTEWLPNHPEDYQALVKVILECKTFGKSIYEIFNLDLIGEDAETSRAIQTIRKAINKIRDNEKINGKYGAINRLFNDFIAKEYSTNPLIKEGFVKLKDAFGDTDRIDFAFSDIESLDHKQVQTVVKYATAIINEATQITAPNAVEEFLNEYDAILNEKGSFNWNRVTPNKGELIKEYKQSFLDDRQKVVDNVKLEAAKGIDRVEYYKAVLERDEWFAAYTHQRITPEYYDKKNRLLRFILNRAPNLYVEYKKLTRELYEHDINNPNRSNRTRRNQIVRQIEQLYSLVNEDGSPKEDDDRNKARSLALFVSDMKELNSQYFKYDEKQGFRESLEYYLNVIKTYERKNPHTTLDVRLQNDAYRDAYDWIQSNTYYGLIEESKQKLNEAYSVLSDKDNVKSNTIKSIIEEENAYDAYGRIDPRKLSSKAIDKIKNITEEKYLHNYDHYLSDDVLIKEIPENRPILSSEFYQSIKTDTIPNAERLAIIKEIRKFVQPYQDRYTGQIDTISLIKDLSNEDRDRLVELYTKIRHIKKTKKEIESAKQFLKKVKVKTNNIAFNREYTKARTELSDKKLLKAWLAIFVEHDKEDNIIFDDEGNYVPAKNVYGYYEVKDKKYIDTKKTNAIKLLNESVRFVETEYYYAAMADATEKGKYEEWYQQNHVFNPYTRRMEPLKIWTNMEVVPNSEIEVSYNYLPSHDNSYKNIRDGKINGKEVAEEPDYRNPYWKPNSVNYKAIDKDIKDRFPTIKDYDNETYYNLTTKERKMVNLLQKTINTYASTNPYASDEMKRFAEKGYLPRRIKETIDGKYWMNQLVGILGYSAGGNAEQLWTKSIDYTDRDAIDFPMMKTIKDKRTKEYIKPEAQGSRTDLEYQKYLNDIANQNKKIKEHNDNIDRELLDDDWRSVMQDFITSAVTYNSKMRVRDTLYLTLEDIKSTKAYDISSYTKDLMTNKKRSTAENTQYQQIEQKRTAELFENWIRRVIYNQFRENNKLNKYADVLQNITSAKYMLVNLPGAIANIGTGHTNIFNEVFARQFFDYSTFNKARLQYANNGWGILKSVYQNDSNNLTAAIIKKFDIVDFDEIRQHKSNDSIHEIVKHVRDAGYGLHSSGEHYMQNVVLLAMLKSHRIVKVGDKYKIMNLSEYRQQLEIDTLKTVIKDSQELSKLYNKFINGIKRDLNKVKDYDSFKRDVNADFLRAYCSKDIAEKYFKLRNEAHKNSKEMFEKNPTFESKFELKNGRAVLINDGTITGIQFGTFKQRVQDVNKYIHGVYDKIGAARIQKEWWGGLIMQYHKHIYPGILKRFRVKGYYNEIRGNIEQGTYITLANYLSTEFEGIKDRIDSRKANNENAILASVQEVIKTAIDTILNLKYNYQTLSDWQRDNLRRILGDLMGITVSMLLAIAIHLGADDDEIDERNDLATLLYIADRLNTEAQMYTPWGLYAEASTLWSSPVASMTAPSDLLKGLGIVVKYLANDDFDINYTTGLYKGQNKLAVLLYRNTPIYRNINRILHMKENNSYYRINETALNIKLAKNIASVIKED